MSGAPRPPAPAPAGGRVIPLALASALTLLVLALQLSALVRSPAELQWPAVPVEMFLPGLFHEGGRPDVTWLAERRPPSEAHLPLAALRGTILSQHTVTTTSLTVGFLPLLLAGYGLLAARGALAHAGRITLALATSLVALEACRDHEHAPDAGFLLPVVVALALLAGAALAQLHRRAPADRSEGPAMALGAAAILLAAVLIGLSLRAGAVTDARVMQPLLDRPVVAWEHDLLRTPEAIAASAAWTRAVLDRAALAAFASMSVLLLHLRSRGTLTGILVVLAVAADLLSVRMLL